MGIGVNSNLLMMNTNRHFNINVGNKAKASEKLASGYRINRAADDAAGLQISEKMRSQIRGLERAAANAQDGISWLQTADGALNEVHAILHRMRELTVQSLNDTYTPADRAKCQVEFDALQSEIDNITKKTEFNNKTVFAEHGTTYYQYEGNAKWEQAQPHVISSNNNDLTINYRNKETDAVETASFSVPEGIYTTQELIDEIDDAIIAQGLDEKGFVFELTDDGTCNVNFENGEIIDDVHGGLSFLLYDMYEGGSMGALIGTTIFKNEFVKINISNQNNNLSFDVENFDGSKTNINITIPTGKYTRQEMIDYLNSELSNYSTNVEATAYGTGIKLEGEDSIVTGFKGNMFKIDGSGTVYDSVFYDNVKYGNVTMTKASFVGGLVKPTAANQEEHWKYKINSTNNELSFVDTNSSGQTATMIIPEGEYTVEEMIDKLNQFFADDGLELTASVSSTGSYKGIIITSNEKGQFSKVGVDSSSSAYNTLFTRRDYNSYTGTATYSNETKANINAKVSGAKEFSGANIPFEITAGVNDSFNLSIDGSDYKITMDVGTYTDAQSIANMLNNKFSDASADVAYKDKVQALVSNNKIILQTVDNTNIVDLSAKADGTNNGYDNIFVKHTTKYSYPVISSNGSSGTAPVITLPADKIGDSTTFNSSNNKLVINLNGYDREVIFPTNQAMTRDEIAAEIENQIPHVTGNTDNTFATLNCTGDTDTKSISASGNGNTSSSSRNYKDTGDSSRDEGNVGEYKNNEAAIVTIDAVIPSSFTVNDTCNKISLNVNGNEKELTLANKTYSRNELVAEIQKKINESYKNAGLESAKVYLNSQNKLVIESELIDEHGNSIDGKSTLIECSTNSSSLLKELFTTRTQAVAESNYNLLSNISITDDTNKFNFSYVENGVNKNVSVTLDNGTYTRSSFVNELNSKLAGEGVKASLNSAKLVLTSTAKGIDNSISYSSTNGGTATEALFGPLTTKTPATGIVNTPIQDTITIDDTSNEFNIKVNGVNQSITLDNGTYNRTDFINMLNSKLSSVGVTATLENNRIRYTTDKAGSDASLYMTYVDGGNSMKAMYGTTPTVSPGVKADFNGDGKLVLTTTTNNNILSVKAAENNLFYEATATDEITGPTVSEGYTSIKKAYVDGVNLTEPITINNYNNELNFKYNMNGTTKNISLTVPDGDYYFTNAGGNQSIVDYLQSELDAQAGAGQLVVTAGSSGIRIEAVNPGSKYTMSGFSGDFYDKVLGKCEQKYSTLGIQAPNGTQNNDLAYTVGRKDIRNGVTSIKTGINDTLNLDFTYTDSATGVPKVYQLELVLDKGDYSGTTLTNEIQKKLNDALVAKGLEAGTIEAGIGGVNTGVSGSNDNNALVFKLSSSVRLPGPGQYIIDGVSGNAAFSVFYQTDGELVPAYIKGARDITEGTTINSGETELSINVDGTRYSIDIPEGDYTGEEILNEINNQFATGNVPLIAEIDDGNLKFSYIKMGKHVVNDISGAAKDELFYVENKDKDKYQDMKIQVGANANQLISLTRIPLDTAYLKINSIAITQPKYANKALLRLDDAIEKVSEVRSEFGSQHNRLTHALDNNLNAEENLQAAESRIRDTDMATEIMKHSKNAILEQAASAMQAQMQNMSANILSLLE